MYHTEQFYGLGAEDYHRSAGLGLVLPVDFASDFTPDSGFTPSPTSSSDTPWWANILTGAARTIENVLTPLPTYNPAIYTPPIIPAPASPGFPSYYPTGIMPTSFGGISTGALVIGGGLLLLLMSRRRRTAGA